jgi:hypothetical protein
MIDRTSPKPKGKAAVPMWKLLQTVFDGVQCERRFPWLALPRGDEAMEIEAETRQALIEHCRSTQATQMNKKKRECSPELLALKLTNPPRPKLEFDFFVPDLNLAFEYDERQHFTLERAASLEAYRDKVRLYFDAEVWIEKCRRTKCADTHPIWRDWQRAYRDAVRDISAAKNGVRLIRYAYDNLPTVDELCRLSVANRAPA